MLRSYLLFLAATVAFACGTPAAPAQQEAAPATHVARISGGVMAGQILQKVDPIYPDEARMQGISGTVVMQALIGSDGTVRDLTAISGPDVLREAALSAVRLWVYKPYILNGNAVDVQTMVTVNFNLQPR